MNAKVLCTLLGLPEQPWPPDHLTLLGLPPGEGDPASLERSVHERMAKLRCLQLSHPDEATEGMNRVAQAYIELSETMSRQGSVATVQSASPSAGTTNTTVQLDTHQDWRAAPPPIRTQEGTALTAELTVEELSGTDAVRPAADSPAVPSAPVSIPVDPLVEIAQHSLEARRGLVTIPAIIDRIDRTRQILIAWKQIGRYMSDPGRRLTRAGEGVDLTKRLRALFKQVKQFPEILGHPGKPGYRVVAMARLDMTAEMFKSLDRTRREELARDWENGSRVLLLHRQYLLQRFRELRPKGWVSSLTRGARDLLNDYPVPVVLGAIVVLSVCLWWFLT